MYKDSCVRSCAVKVSSFKVFQQSLYLFTSQVCNFVKPFCLNVVSHVLYLIATEKTFEGRGQIEDRRLQNFLVAIYIDSSKQYKDWNRTQLFFFHTVCVHCSHFLQFLPSSNWANGQKGKQYPLVPQRFLFLFRDARSA